MAKQVQQQTTETKTAAAKAKTQNRGTKAETGKQVQTKAAEVKPVFVVSNAPGSGRYLFAYTAAVMAVIGTLPKAKQAIVAMHLHGKRAMRYHGPEGTRKIVPQASGEVQYDKGYFLCGPSSFDEKRRAVPSSWVEAFKALILNGEYPKQVADGFNYPLPIVTDKTSPRHGKPVAMRIDVGLK